MATGMIDIEEERTFKEIFRILDRKISGYIPCKDFQLILLAVKTEVGLTDDDIQEVLDDADKNKDGKITFNEFYKFMVDYN
ncbi:troponin C, slow skeletal and cardiac muscles-like [Gigantopelta aegis]|uniref:troponin C, slow skeletal and cardiac muscles-like n=1 Tax=Gigantopelta aegis TaxID=1735272 RepID=UPI001B8880EC|nr:troponin C, slow skeletal and cardiac muscles-like [Gigantopelta aegis]XP_041363611.1 troponin C, slow skeletal and cardiac muscles-like [Gigantopelta aegis]